VASACLLQLGQEANADGRRPQDAGVLPAARKDAAGVAAPDANVVEITPEIGAQGIRGIVGGSMRIEEDVLRPTNGTIGTEELVRRMMIIGDLLLLPVVQTKQMQEIQHHGDRRVTCTLIEEEEGAGGGIMAVVVGLNF
jgi:hypothetical protein